MADRGHRRDRRAVTNHDFLIWPNATVPYTIDNDFSSKYASFDWLEWRRISSDVQHNGLHTNIIVV